MKGGGSSHFPNDWKFDEEGYARINGFYIDFPMFNPRKGKTWKIGGNTISAINLKNLYSRYRDLNKFVTDDEGRTIIIVQKERSIHDREEWPKRIFWVDEEHQTVCLTPDCSSPPKLMYYPSANFEKQIENQKAYNLQKSKNSLEPQASNLRNNISLQQQASNLPQNRINNNNIRSVMNNALNKINGLSFPPEKLVKLRDVVENANQIYRMAHSNADIKEQVVSLLKNLQEFVTN
jgi:hypothetical protein